MDYDINDKINLLYDYVYNINSQECSDYNKISLGNISINNTKLTIDNEFYNKIFEQIIKGKFKFILHNNSFYYKKYSHDFPVTFKISFYKSEKELNNIIQL